MWEVGDLPFFVKHLKEPHNLESFPNFLTFSLVLDPSSGTLMQSPDNVVIQALKKAYLHGSEISGIMDNFGIGKKYADDFIIFIKKSLKRKDFNGVKVLEIGCGYGYLLNRLKSYGAIVQGVEPGNHSLIGSKKFNIPIINDFFPTNELNGAFDLILLYDLLEHIADPVLFLKELRNNLAENGSILLCVEDEEPYINYGDISFLFHEHFSYFIKETLQNTLNLSGYNDVNIIKSEFSSLLYASVRVGQESENLNEIDIKKYEKFAKQFKNYAINVNTQIKNYIYDAINKSETIGIFVPGRIINVLSIVDCPLNNLRFFDDNPILHGTYFPGFNIPIESRESLINKPVDRLIIMSASFGKKIAEELTPLLPKKTETCTWSDIFENEFISLNKC
ncbi:MAG: class I SAM-dependent methyltransferase [Desulfobacteraceae bacterium]|nr:class I SAM-dependent methyltransferase [Desulfobacteraceae bacterium]